MNQFSPLETKVLKALGRRKLSIAELTEKIYKRVPLNGATTVGTAIIRINKKCQLHKLDWHLEGQGLGRGGKTVWVEKKS